MLLVAAAVTSAAQPAQPRRPRDEAHRMVDAYIVSNLQESLGLTDEQFVKLLPLVKRLQKDRREFATRRIGTLQEMRRLLESGSATEPRVGELLKEVKAVEAEEPQAVRRNVEAIDAVLTPLQQAKYRLLEVEVDRKIRELMARMRDQARPRWRMGGEAPEPPPQP